MNYRFVPMNAEHAKACDGWRYSPPYDFYDLRSDEGDRDAFMNPDSWGTELFAVLDDGGELSGYFVFKDKGEGLYIGLGMRPDLTGRGLGSDFVEAGISFGARRLKMFAPDVVLEVAEFNTRAIKLYGELGFAATKRFRQKTNDGEFLFIRMEKPSKQRVTRNGPH